MILRPYIYECFYCEVEYDVIGRIEEYEEDMLYIAMRQNLTSSLKEFSKVKNKTQKKNESTSMRIMDHMSQIPREAREKLFQLYKVDLKMFDYEYTQFL